MRPADAECSRMIERFGAATTTPGHAARNTLKATAEDIAAALDAAGIARPSPGTERLYPARGPGF